MSRIFIAGDLHGGYHEDIQKLSLEKWPEQKQLSKEDYLIQCGDFGYIWYHEKHPKYKKDQQELKKLSEKNYTILFVDGNHENHDMLETFPLIPMFGSYVQEVYKGIYRLLRGHIYTINNKTFFIMGGAKSNDNQKEGNYSGIGRNKKLKLQKVWWEDEIPSKEEFELGMINLSKYNYKVDYIVTHTCPKSVILDLYNKTGQINLDRLMDPVSIYLENVANLIKFKEWHFGHHHQDQYIKNNYGDFYCHYNNKPMEILN